MRLALAAFLSGLGLYVAAGATKLGAYDGEPQPVWLTSVWLIATALIALGLLALVGNAVRAYRERL